VPSHSVFCDIAASNSCIAASQSCIASSSPVAAILACDFCNLESQGFKATIPDHLCIQASIPCMVDLHARKGCNLHNHCLAAGNKGRASGLGTTLYLCNSLLAKAVQDVCITNIVSETENNEKYLFEEDAVKERTYFVCLVPIDMNRKLLHVDALRQSSACRCTRHKKDN